MKNISIAGVTATKNFSQAKLTIGLDLGDRSSWFCLLDGSGWNRNWVRLRRRYERYSEQWRAAASRWKRGCTCPGKAASWKADFLNLRLPHFQLPSRARCLDLKAPVGPMPEISRNDEHIAHP